MAIYTGVSDSNGDFTIPFSQNYTGGQKITVKATKDSAEKSIEIFAPSEVIGGDSAIQLSGSLVNYPADVGGVVFSKIKNYANDCFYAINFTSIEMHDVVSIGVNAFRSSGVSSTTYVRILSPNLNTIGNQAFYGYINCTELTILSVKAIGTQSFFNMNKVQNLNLPEGLESIGGSAFYSWTSLKNATLPSTLKSIAAAGCYNWTNCDQITISATIPPTIAADSFSGLKSTCVIRVPSSSLSAYQSAANWSAHASKMVGF